MLNYHLLKGISILMMSIFIQIVVLAVLIIKWKNKNNILLPYFVSADTKFW